MEDIYKKYSKLFCISESEAEDLINQNYNHKNNQERLLNLLGYENIEDVAYIITNINVKKKPTLTVNNKYVEICVKPPKRLHSKNKVSKKCVKEEYQSMFEYEYFNDIQSAVFETAYYTNKNFLLSAPTGCGKTDVAMLVILHALEKEGKVFLIAPMKALATEIYSKTRSRLRKLNINVLEYTGDSVTSYDDLNNAKLIIATPEKFDIMTRKLHFDIVISTLIIDEIHILHNTRGAVIETIVCRMLRHTELFQRHIRIVGLSATLPNYKDVAKFIQAQNTFYFEPGYRPVPLEINLIGVKKQGEECDNTGIIDGNIVQKMEQMHLSGKKEIDIKDLFQNNALEECVFFEDRKSINIKQQSSRDIYNEILEEKIAPLLEANQQVLVFVTSRKETEKTANYLRYKFTTKKFDIHHAGLSKIVRNKVEKNFKDKKIDVIATTSTLAWGVNLPAKCVIIKGTQFYDHESAKFENLGILDVLQIFGRAGRPQFDSTGHAFLITDNKYLNEYYELLNNNTLVESKLLFSFIDIINCEIYLQNIRNLKDAVDWLKTTFLFVRMLKTPLLYGFSPDEIKNKEIDMVLSEYVLIALKRLNDTGMITMKGTGHDYLENIFYHLSGSTAELMTKSFSCSFKSTFLGRVASFYFINFESVNAWVEKIQFVYDEETILDLLLSSKEFDQIILREDEIDSLRMFADDIQVDFVETPKSKMKMLYYLDKLKLNTYKFSLTCDQTYVIENLERIINAFKELIIEYELFNLYDAVCEIKRTVSKSVITKKNTKVVAKSNAKITQIGDYAFIESSQAENIIVDKNDVVIFVTSSKLSFFRSCDTYFTIRNANVEYVELSANEMLYKFGVHTCKEVSWTLFTHQLSCPHYTIAFNTNDTKNSNAVNTHETDDTKSNIDNESYIYTNSFELLKSSTYKAFDSKVLANPVNVIFRQSYNFTFEIVDGYINIENQKLITYNILELPRNENYLIVTTDKKETSKTYNDIKMYNVINNIEIATDTKLRKNFAGYLIADINYILQNIYKIQNNCVVIFKGVLGNHFYPIFDILRIAGNRKCIVYDTRNVIEYLNYLFAQ